MAVYIKLLGFLESFSVILIDEIMSF